MSALLIANAAATLGLLGLIWVVQLVHYPMLAGLRGPDFTRWHRFHASRISVLVVPLMGVEAVTAVLLVLAPPPEVPLAAAGVGLALVIGHVASTAFLQVPLHHRLSTSFDAEAVRRLVATNWIRTGIWTARAALVLALLVG